MCVAGMLVVRRYGDHVSEMATEECTQCGGSGECDDCNGTGRSGVNNCPYCGGSKDCGVCGGSGREFIVEDV